MIYLYALLGFVVFFLLMALGVMLRKKPLRGSCGGLRALPGNPSPCEICGAPPEEQKNCPRRPEVQGCACWDIARPQRLPWKLSYSLSPMDEKAGTSVVFLRQMKSTTSMCNCFQIGTSSANGAHHKAGLIKLGKNPYRWETT
jgi:hypothetical protein